MKDLNKSIDSDFTKKIEKISDFSLRSFISHLKNEHKLNSDEIINVLVGQAKEKTEILIPISIFNNKKLSVLEAVVKFLKEEQGLRHKEIGKLLNRDNRSIWTTYNNAIKKLSKKFIIKDSKFHIPVGIFSDRRLGALEALSEYLKDNNELSYHKIAVLLNRNDRTIWSSYNNSKKKKRGKI